MSKITNDLNSSLFQSEDRNDDIENNFSYLKKSELEQSEKPSFSRNEKNNNTIKIKNVPYTESEKSTNDDDINQKYQEAKSEIAELKKIKNSLSEENEKLKNENKQYKKKLEEFELKVAYLEKKLRDYNKNQKNLSIQEYKKKH